MTTAQEMLAIARIALREMRHPADAIQYRDAMMGLRSLAQAHRAGAETIAAYDTIIAWCNARIDGTVAGEEADTMFKNFKDVNDVKRANKRAGYHFFDPDTMEAFKSRIETELHAGCLFVTSEVYGDDDAPRVYQIRIAREDGSVRNVGPHFETRKEAIDNLNLLAASISGDGTFYAR